MINYKNLILECDAVIEEFPKYIDEFNLALEKFSKTETLIAKLKIDIDEKILKEIEEYLTFYKFQTFIIISQLDLAVNIKNLVNSKTKWEQLFFIRNSFLVVHEILKKIKYNTFYEQIIKSKYPEIENEFKNFIDNIENFKKDYPNIALVRNKTASHYENNFKNFYNILMNIDIEDSTKILIEFYKISILSSEIIKKYALLFKINFNNKILEIQKK